MRITSFTVSSSYKIGFDHSYSSYETLQSMTVELHDPDNHDVIRAQAQEIVRDNARIEAEQFKAHYDVPRPAGSKSKG